MENQSGKSALSEISPVLAIKTTRSPDCFLVSSLPVFVLHKESHVVNKLLLCIEERIKLAKVATFCFKMKVKVQVNWGNFFILTTDKRYVPLSQQVFVR